MAAETMRVAVELRTTGPGEAPPKVKVIITIPATGERQSRMRFGLDWLKKI
jgi:hypothetical protein